VRDGGEGGSGDVDAGLGWLRGGGRIGGWGILLVECDQSISTLCLGCCQGLSGAFFWRWSSQLRTSHYSSMLYKSYFPPFRSTVTTQEVFAWLHTVFDTASSSSCFTSRSLVFVPLSYPGPTFFLFLPLAI
jgi:hypothetical protein